MQSEIDLKSAEIRLFPGMLSAFEAQIESLNKKARRYGVPPIKIEGKTTGLYERREEEMTNGKTLRYLRPLSAPLAYGKAVHLLHVQVSYAEIRNGHWLLVGKFDAIPGKDGAPSGNFTRTISRDNEKDDERMQALRYEPVKCEHCNSNRRRKEGYLLRNLDTGEYKRVGSTCLKDFTGIEPSQALLAAEMAFVCGGDWSESSGGGGRGFYENTLDFLTRVAFVSTHAPFVSVKAAKETSGVVPTYSEALNLPDEMTKKRALRKQFFDELPHHEDKARKVLAWVAANPERSEFISNLKMLAELGYMTEVYQCRVMAASLPMYDRAMQSLRDAERASQSESRHVGTEGMKLSANLVLDRIVPISTGYGPAQLVLLHDQDGNAIRWKTASFPDALRNASPGARFDAAFKVAKHDLYQGKPQTRVTHLKLLGAVQ